jgi:hypothetical protein
MISLSSTSIRGKDDRTDRQRDIKYQERIPDAPEHYSVGNGMENDGPLSILEIFECLKENSIQNYISVSFL